jgi:hypothetical protein
MTLQQTAELLNQMDDDSDGKLNFREFLEMWRKANDGDVPRSVRAPLLQSIFQLGIQPKGKPTSSIRFAGARGFFERHTKEETAVAQAYGNGLQKRWDNASQGRWGGKQLNNTPSAPFLASQGHSNASIQMRDVVSDYRFSSQR